MVPNVLTLVMTLAFVVAWTVVPLAAADALPRDASGVQPLGTALSQSFPGGEVRLPLIRPGGRLDREFPDGIPFWHRVSFFERDESKLDDVVRRIAFDAEVDDVAEALLTRGGGDPFVLDRLTRVAYYVYPYQYPQLDDVVGSALSRELVSRNEEHLVELSSALLLTDRAPAAFSLLNRMRDLQNSCSTQLNLAVTVAAGFAPDPGVVDSEFQKAAELCDEDPAALVAHSRVVLARDTRVMQPLQYRDYPLGELGQEDQALALAAQAQQRFPEHAAGYSAEAAIRLEIAAKYTDAGVHPFTTRAMYRRALELLEAVAVVQPDDPTVAFGRARALAGLGEPGEAGDVAGSVLNRFVHPAEREAATRMVYGWHLAAGRPEAALAVLPEPYPEGGTSLDGTWRCRSIFPAGFLEDRAPQSLHGIVGQLTVPPEPGWLGTCYTHLEDATGGERPGGADVLHFFGYIPTHRWDWVSPGVLKVVSGHGGDLDESSYRDADGIDLSAINGGRWDELGPDAAGSIERIQDAYRRMGMFGEAEDLLQTAMQHHAAPAWVLWDRLGELHFLQGRYAQAAQAFGKAAALAQDDQMSVWSLLVNDSLYLRSAPLLNLTVGYDWAVIKQATALGQAGDTQGARALLSDLRIQWRNDGDDSYFEKEAVDMKVLTQATLLGTVEVLLENYEEAVPIFQHALATCQTWEEWDVDPCASGVQHNNLAMTLMKLELFAEAEDHARSAVASDPANAMYLEGLANILQLRGDSDAATEAYREALRLDPTQHTAHNNLGVLLAEVGKTDDAIDHFRAALGINADYAPAWFNAGVSLLREGGLGAFVQGQGALGHAGRLDSALRSAEPEWVTDVAIYDSGLDLSKPLPMDWVAGPERKPAPLPLNLMILVVSLLLVAKAIIGDQLSGHLIERALKSTSRRTTDRWSSIGEVPAIAVCVAVVGAAFGFSAAWQFWPTIVGIVAAGLFTLSLVAARWTVGHNIEHTLSPGGALLGLVTTPLGLTFAPTPVLRPEVPTMVRWAPHAALTIVTTLALALTWLGAVPITRELAQLSLLILASSLIPVKPFDGSILPRRLSVFVAIGLVAPSALLAGGWL